MTLPPLPVSSLRAYLLSSLTSLPGSRSFHIHILVSAARKPAQSPFAYASPRPKCLVQNIVVLLSEEVGRTGDEQEGQSDASNKAALINITPHTFVSAIEASIYTFSASNSTILYISKVDGTGQGMFPSPTSTLVCAFVSFYASPRSPLYTAPVTHHLWIHLFARSQRQYLFPNSADHPNKSPLGDIALCKWWKSILSNLAKSVQEGNTNSTADLSSAAALTSSPPAIRLYYLLPGQSELEALYLLREPHTSSKSNPVPWIYSHPYDICAEMDLPYPSAPSDKMSSKDNCNPVASIIPYFEDDPKSRFLDELAATSEEQVVAVPVPTPKRKRAKIEERDQSENKTSVPDASNADLRPKSSTLEANKDKVEAKSDEENAPTRRLDVPPTIVFNPPSSPPHIDQSPPFRPSTFEPSESPRTPLHSPRTPDLPTFPTSLFSPGTPSPHPSLTAANQISSHPGTPLAPRTPRRPISDLDTISLTDFWERMSYRQECAQGAVTGFFVAVFSQRRNILSSDDNLVHASHSTLDAERPHTSHPITSTDPHPTLLEEGTVPHSVIKRVMTSLLTGVEFSTTERTHKGTQVIETAIQGLCDGLGHVNNASARANHIDESEVSTEESKDASFEIYRRHVYGHVSVSNPALVRTSPTAVSKGTPVVNVLGVKRRKKKDP